VAQLAIVGGDPVRTEEWPQWPIYDEREIEAVQEVVKSSAWTTGPYRYEWSYVFPGHMYDGLRETRVSQLEAKFAHYHDTTYGIATGSGTSALQIAYCAAGAGSGDELIMPCLTFIATASAALQLDGVPILVDVDPETLCIDPSAIEAAITERTKLIVPLHLGGYPADMDRIAEIAARHGLKVVADSCHAHGTEWRGKKVASLSDLSAFSFQQAKQVTAGEGGMIITGDEELYALCYMYHNDGRGMADEDGVWTVQGWDYRMSEFQAAIALVQLERLDAIIDTKERNARVLAQRLAEIGGLRFPREDERITRQNYLSPRLRYEPEAFDGVPAGLFARALAAEGIPCGARGGRPLYQHPLFVERRFDTESAKRVDYTQVHCPQAESLAGKWIGFRQSVLLGSEEGVGDFARAVEKVKDNVGELRGIE
jgi:dTDP-4-amino-4,6-dideoxygalactose transaminase